jgi:titin
LSWQPPTNDGGAPILGYHLERQSSFSTRWARVNKDLIEVTTLELSDFVEDNTYTFRVIAENKAGPSNPSLPSDTIKAKNPWSKKLFIYIVLYGYLMPLSPIFQLYHYGQFY